MAVDEAIRVCIDPIEDSVVAALGNTHGQKSNNRRINFNIILVSNTECPILYCTVLYCALVFGRCTVETADFLFFTRTIRTREIG